MVRDTYSRQMKDLRISVTDRCNFRCTYCMPFDEYEWVDKKEILTFEEITRLANLFVQLGVDKIRLTGGEPLLRSGLEKLISKLSSLNGLEDLCLTTNGSLLAEKVSTLKSAGLRRINVSLDTLNSEKFARIRRRGDLAKVLEGLFAAKRCGLHPIKINMVVERGVNDDEAGHTDGGRRGEQRIHRLGPARVARGHRDLGALARRDALGDAAGRTGRFWRACLTHRSG